MRKSSIKAGDILICEDGYAVVVRKIGNDLVGQLICPADHSCSKVAYSLNNGNGHVKLREWK
jgi:urease accessory protein UreE